VLPGMTEKRKGRAPLLYPGLPFLQGRGREGGPLWPREGPKCATKNHLVLAAPRTNSPSPMERERKGGLKYIDPPEGEGFSLLGKKGESGSLQKGRASSSTVKRHKEKRRNRPCQKGRGKRSPVIRI